jgi:hypothetical protein
MRVAKVLPTLAEGIYRARIHSLTNLSYAARDAHRHSFYAVRRLLRNMRTLMRSCRGEM